jgi:hypothetical protein
MQGINRVAFAAVSAFDLLITTGELQGKGFLALERRSHASVLRWRGHAMPVIAEKEHYLLVSDGRRFTVVERRAGKFYPLCNGIRHGLDLDDEGVAQLMRLSGSYSELEARRRLATVAEQWRELFEHVR